MTLPRQSSLSPVRPSGGAYSEQHSLRLARVMEVRPAHHKVRVAFLDGGKTDWIPVVSALAGADHGLKALPQVNDLVLVGFLRSNEDFPIVIGSVYEKWETILQQEGYVVRDGESEKAVYYQHPTAASHLYLSDHGDLVGVASNADFRMAIQEYVMSDTGTDPRAINAKDARTRRNITMYRRRYFPRALIAMDYDTSHMDLMAQKGMRIQSYDGPMKLQARNNLVVQAGCYQDDRDHYKPPPPPGGSGGGSVPVRESGSAGPDTPWVFEPARAYPADLILGATQDVELASYRHIKVYAQHQLDIRSGKGVLVMSPGWTAIVSRPSDDTEIKNVKDEPPEKREKDFKGHTPTSVEGGGCPTCHQPKSDCPCYSGGVRTECKADCSSATNWGTPACQGKERSNPPEPLKAAKEDVPEKPTAEAGGVAMMAEGGGHVVMASDTGNVVRATEGDITDRANSIVMRAFKNVQMRATNQVAIRAIGDAILESGGDTSILGTKVRLGMGLVRGNPSSRPLPVKKPGKMEVRCSSELTMFEEATYKPKKMDEVEDKQYTEDAEETGVEDGAVVSLKTKTVDAYYIGLRLITELFLELYNAHTHTDSVGGETTPPLSPAPASFPNLTEFTEAN